MPTEHPCFIVDAFTERRFAGNQAAVCFLDKELPAAEYQRIAREFGFSETAFPLCLDASAAGDVSVAERVRSATRFSLRWFTPAKEVPLCGHATLATAHAIFNELGNESERLTFESASGELAVGRAASGGSALTMDFPAYEVYALKTCAKGGAHGFPEMEDVEGVGERLANAAVGTGKWAELLYAPEAKKLVVVLPPDTGRQHFESLRPNAAELLRMDVESRMAKGLIVTFQPGDPQEYKAGAVDYVSRYFAPWVGVDEDPATGSSQSALGPLWARKLQRGGETLRAYQCFPGRGADFLVQHQADAKRVKITGSAVTFVRGTVLL